MALRSMLGLTEPHTFMLMDRFMATIMATGDPDRLGSEIVPVLYEAVNELRERRPFELEPLRARWADGANFTRTERPAMWGLPVPMQFDSIPQPDPQHVVRIEIWEYGNVAEILHEGSRAERGRAIDMLNRYMRDEKLEVIGPYEEEYLSPPDAAVPKTLIRYRVNPR